MRTTVTLDPDTAAIVRGLMRDRGVTFKEALNDAIRSGSPARRRGSRRTRTYDMGQPAIPLEAALRLAGDFEDEALIRKLAERR